jgi:hypothetical protein
MAETVEGFGLPAKTGVWVCERVLDGDPILHVSRDADKQWHFLCGGSHADDACPLKLVCLADVLNLDPDVSGLGDLCCSFCASRAAKTDPWARVDEYEGVVLGNVDKFGWHVVLIEAGAEGPAFAYSIGLFRSYKQPEVIGFGLRPSLLHSIINGVGDELKQGRSIELDVPLDGYIEGYPVIFKAVAKKHYREYLGYALWFYSRAEFPVIQCIWPDKSGRFPWDRDFNKDWIGLQPLLM